MGFAAAVREAWCLCGSRFSAPPMLCRRMNPNPLVRGRNTTLGYSLCKLLDGRHFIARGEHSNFFFHHCFHRRTARRCSSAANDRRKAIKPRFQRENRQIHANHTGSLSPAMVCSGRGFFGASPIYFMVMHRRPSGRSTAPGVWVGSPGFLFQTFCSKGLLSRSGLIWEGLLNCPCAAGSAGKTRGNCFYCRWFSSIIYFRV